MEKLYNFTEETIKGQYFLFPIGMTGDLYRISNCRHFTQILANGTYEEYAVSYNIMSINSYFNDKKWLYMFDQDFVDNNSFVKDLLSNLDNNNLIILKELANVLNNGQ